MKLYTEKEVRNSMNSMKIYIEKYNENVIDKIIENHIRALGGIELPSDEEIEEVGHNHQRGGYEWQNEKRKSFIEGIKYLIYKIQGGNNEQR